jgi:hypothetical protein
LPFQPLNCGDNPSAGIEGGLSDTNAKMKISHWFVLGSLIMTSSACISRKPAEPDLLNRATIKDIMDSMVDPSGDFMFESVQEISDERGITRKAPHSDDDWKAVRNHDIVLLEAPNLLTMSGRKVAQPGEKSKNPQVELQPEEIQKLIDYDRVSFVRRARRLQDAATSALKAIDAKDVDALFLAIDGIDKACENCHLHYWYPNDKRAQEAAKEEGIVD